MRRWRKRKPLAPLGYRPWPQQDAPLKTEQLISLYNQGFAGTIYDPAADEEMLDAQEWPDGERAASEFGLVGSGAGKLSIPFLPAYRHWPKCWPCPGQDGPDCVGHGGKNSHLVLIAVEAELGTPDPDTGIVEGFPEVSAEAEAHGVVACEASYGARGHGGGGANCSTVIKYSTTTGGVLLRQNYPEAGIDLTRYNYSISAKWGRTGPPAALNAIAKQHQVRTATNCDSHEICRDFVANGYPIWCCSGLGWSSSRDENGYSRRQGGWSHSWIVMGYDDRPEIVSKYGFPLFLYNHDWGKWNGGGRRILGTEIDIPEGSFWGDARLLNNCDCTALSNLNGFPMRPINNLLI